MMQSIGKMSIQQRGTSSSQRVPPSAPKKQPRSKLAHLNYPSNVVPNELSAHERMKIVNQINLNWDALYSVLGRTRPPTKKDELASPSYSECLGRATLDDWTQATIPSAPLPPPTLKSILKKKNGESRLKSASFGDTVFHVDYFEVEDLQSKFDVYDCAIYSLVFHFSPVTFISHLFSTVQCRGSPERVYETSCSLRTHRTRTIGSIYS